MPERWIDQPWAKNPEVLIESLANLYREAILRGKATTVAEVALKKAMLVRKWCPLVPQKALLRAIEDLELIYVPKGLSPGPGFLFPVRDATGEIRRAVIRVNDETVYGTRYITAGDRAQFVGPSWAGMTPWCMGRILETHAVLVVEGPWDLVAVRTVAPGIPSVSPLTKKLTAMHWVVLRILGVERVYTMLDNDNPGRQAGERLKDKHPDVEVTIVQCPSKDPADALQTPSKLQGLQRALASVILDTPTTIIQEED